MQSSGPASSSAKRSSKDLNPRSSFANWNALPCGAPSAMRDATTWVFLAMSIPMYCKARSLRSIRLSEGPPSASAARSLVGHATRDGHPALFASRCRPEAQSFLAEPNSRKRTAPSAHDASFIPYSLSRVKKRCRCVGSGGCHTQKQWQKEYTRKSQWRIKPLSPTRYP